MADVFGQTVLVTDAMVNDTQMLQFAKGARFVGGHFGAEVREAVRGDGYVFTVLRDPLDRVISYWRFAQSHTDDHFRFAHKDLSELITQGSSDELFRIDNVMARQLGAGIDQSTAGRVPRDEWVDRALDALRGMDRVIQVSELQVGVEGVLRDNGLSHSKPIAPRNRTDGQGRRNLAAGIAPPKVDAEKIAALIEPYIELDRELMMRWAAEA